MVVEIAIVGGLLWAGAITVLCTPAGNYTSFWDRITKAKYRNDKVTLQIMLDHLRSYPEQWSINRNAASFPAQGAKQIYLSYDKHDNVWKYTLQAFDDGPRKLDGHFGAEFARELNKVNNQKENQALLRNFYPDLDNGVLLLK